MTELYEIEKTILKLLADGKNSEEVGMLLNAPTAYIDTCLYAIRRKTGVTSNMDLLIIGQRLVEEDARKDSEITQERAGRIQQCISALLLEENLTEEEQRYLMVARAKWDARSLEKWREVS